MRSQQRAGRPEPPCRAACGLCCGLPVTLAAFAVARSWWLGGAPPGRWGRSPRLSRSCCCPLLSVSTSRRRIGGDHQALGHGVHLDRFPGLPPLPASRLGQPLLVGVTPAARGSVPQGESASPSFQHRAVVPGEWCGCPSGGGRSRSGAARRAGVTGRTIPVAGGDVKPTACRADSPSAWWSAALSAPLGEGGRPGGAGEPGAVRDREGQGDRQREGSGVQPDLQPWPRSRAVVAWSELVTAGAVAADLAVQPRRHPAADQ